MSAYWLLFIMVLLGVLVPGRLPETQSRILWFGVGSIIAVFIGFRHEVGADWFNYLPHFYKASSGSFVDALAGKDPGYSVTNWLVFRAGGDIYWVNFLCAAVLVWGTVRFCRKQPHAWLALLIAVPYLLIVVGMGYTRQAVALGFALMGLAALGAGHARSFVVWIVIGALFHKSAVLLLPIAALAASRNRLLTILLVALVTLMTYFLLLEASAEALWMRYVRGGVHSEGGAVRVLMNVVPALLLFFFRNRLGLTSEERRLWVWVAAFAVACFPLVYYASTAVDRVALYAIPLQLFVFSRLPRLARTKPTRALLALSVAGYYALVLFVWLNYAGNAESWVPYESALT